jgi:hypothetical protein
LDEPVFVGSVEVLDELLADQPVEAATLAGAKGLPRYCRPGRHDWVKETRFNCSEDCNDAAAHLAGTHQTFRTYCDKCGIPKDEAKSRMGRKVVLRSKNEERRLAKFYKGRRTGHRGGPDDVQTELTNIQSKAGTGWWSKRYWEELVKLPRTGGRVPALIVSNGEPGHLVRRMVVMEERDFRALFGDLLLDPPQPDDETVARVMDGIGNLDHVSLEPEPSPEHGVYPVGLKP